MKYTHDTTDKFAGFGVDTIVVLFFLAIEIGRSDDLFSVDGMLMSATLIMVLLLPYFLPSRIYRPSVTRWLAVRGTIAVAALILGVLSGSDFAAAPASYHMVPMTFLILSSMVSAYVQFYGLMRLRPAK